MTEDLMIILCTLVTLFSLLSLGAVVGYFWGHHIGAMKNETGRSDLEEGRDHLQAEQR